ncbi:putative RNA-binding component of the eukaryotic translation initiation factor 3 (eIF-3) complex, which is involved in protein synthesis of a specialized repertoire of mRNAs and, together with other initiation factors, stimulates binding of mRNA and methionyl-tRNAi to the 40S ribosome [Lyophyllum shimeji]|uniref:Eukaryotic translation initiation factor 3 subunit A n=1 Tax=Lyophyllum shimeji TaxID=47721 RepID=A0A9P3PW90_LYOSH|nr:putative RNA-binding component of the eukaryotic translation initiation factor 3 (eIF-3) complex, which is involved in protein synthesis of a specialized repertoire of mRNAs and, together with other initiation factors, stimulates binding of mRNA and methionyl-tRNAi to the 40S ribosome [Lyophyllum shimeji]
MAPFSKPETVLKQAEGLVSVGQTHAALQSLTEMFSSKRFRSTPLTSLEPIMMRFVELCVDMRKGRTAKEGLMQYKNIAQNTSVQSIEAVITRFVQLADAKVREAQEKAAVKSAVDVDDLEASETPESILLGAVSGDQSKDRTDRALVTPWLKFLWESYRTSLETLKNNARLEAIYQQIAQQAFKFCLKHQRKVEFRRLCETLRLHLSNVAKYANQPHSINLSDADTLQHHLDTRFAQLNTSVELELWQEAFRSVEDVHNLLTMAKKAPRPAMMANYYEKLTKIFLMSGNALYHAAAWGRYYAIVTSIGGKSDEELSKLAGQVLVSALAVPVGLHTEEQDELKGKNARLSALLGLTKVPTRAGLLKDALSRDVLKLSPEPIKALYNILEVTFDPLTLCASIAPLLTSLSAEKDPESPYAPYLTLLQRALLSRLLSQLSQVYSTITISSLLSLVAPLRDAGLPGAYDDAQIEGYIMGCARRGELSIRVDHKTGSITFVDDAFAPGDEQAAVAAAGVEVGVQPSMAELVRTRLGRIAGSLYDSLQRLEREEKKLRGEPAVSEEEQRERFRKLVAAAEGERKALQLRRALVARRRELLSELSVRKEKEETSRRAEISRREKEEETRRAREEMRRKEQERTKKELESIRIDEAKKYAQSLVEKGILKPNDVDKLETVDTEGLIVMQVAQLEKEKKELSEKLRIAAKRVDHLERAYRKEERPLLAQDYERQQQHDRETHEAVQHTRKEAARATHEEDMATKARLARVMDDYLARREVLVARKAAEFAQKKEAARQKIEEEKAKRRAAVLKAREEERQRLEREEKARREKEEEEARLAAERAAEEERRRAEEAAAAAAAEAAKREAEEKAAALRREREAERAAALEKARLQQQREEEAEARRLARQAEKAAALRAPVAARAAANGEPTAWRRSTPVSAAAVPTRAGVATPPRAESPAPPRFVAGGGAAAGGGWREREAARRAAGGAAPPARGAGTASPRPGAAPLPKEEPKKDEDGFQPAKAVYRPRQARG